jgi:LysM repeat protein
MTKRTTALARVAAFTALVAAFLVVVVVIATSLSGDSGTADRHPATGQEAKQRRKVDVPATYVVQNGDTLTSIAHKTGISVARIETLNPGVDPQILISGEKLKLR